jgi:hypothetical protein
MSPVTLSLTAGEFGIEADDGMPVMPSRNPSDGGARRDYLA